MKGKNLITFIAIALFLSIAASSAKAVVKDSPYGDLIANTAFVNYIGYTFSAYNNSDTNTADTYVDLIVGGTLSTYQGSSFTYWEGDTNYIAVNPTIANQFDTLYYEFANTGNDTETFSIKVRVDSMWLTSQTTDFYIGIDTTVSDGLNDFLDTASTLSASTQNYADSSIVFGEDAIDTFYFNVRIDLNGVGGEGCTVVVSILTASHDTAVNTGEYTGDNGDSYAEGGLVAEYDTFYLVIVAPNIKVGKSDTVTLGGSLSAAIPGATIHYQLTFDNIGNDTANSVFLYDHIDTNYLVLVDSAPSNADTVWLSTKDNPTLEFQNASGDWQTGFTSSAQWIKFDYDTVGYTTAGTNKNDTIVFNVYIN